MFSAKKTSIGFHLNKHSIKYAELLKKKDGFHLGLWGEEKLPSSVIEDGSIKDIANLKKIFAKLKTKVGSKNITMSFFSDQIFLADLLKEAGFGSVYFESEAQALQRVFVPKGSTETFMIVYIGSTQTFVFAANEKEVSLLSVINLNSAFFEKISGAKMIYPILKDKLNEQYISWHTHKDENGKMRPKIQKIILAGDVPEMQKLASYLWVNLRAKVEVGSVWGNILDLDKNIPEMTLAESERYGIALGLAFRGF